MRLRHTGGMDGSVNVVEGPEEGLCDPSKSHGLSVPQPLVAEWDRDRKGDGRDSLIKGSTENRGRHTRVLLLCVGGDKPVHEPLSV